MRDVTRYTPPSLLSPRHLPLLFVSFLVLCFAASAAAEMTVDEVIAKHIEARGGVEAWAKIDSLKATGMFTAFSKISPFTLHRERGNTSPQKGVHAKYHLDHVLDNMAVTIGFDGEHAWWINLWNQIPWPQPIAGQDLKVLMQDVDFESPFFHYRDKGYKVELLGEGDLDGQKALRIQLTRPDEAVETWYLNPETYLEIGYDADGSDFGQSRPQRAFIEDFREVDGVMIPHYIEKQWYTRNRVMEIEKVETNLDIDDDLFRMPLAGELGLMRAMVGDWNVKTEERQSPEGSWREGEIASTIESKMNGVMLEESYTTNGVEAHRTLSYDRFKERYRQTQINSFTGHLDVQEGTFEDGRLTVSNAETGTSWQGFGRTFHQRMSFFDITPDGFKVEAEQSIDGGENWFVNHKATYTRKTE